MSGRCASHSIFRGFYLHAITGMGDLQKGGRPFDVANQLDGTGSGSISEPRNGIKHLAHGVLRPEDG